MISSSQPPTDPRRAGGDVVGGDPNTRHSSVLDTRNAVLLNHATVVLVEPYRKGQPDSPLVAVFLEGRINKTKEQSRILILYLMNEDGAAAIISELIAIAGRIGPKFRDRLMSRVRELVDSGHTEEKL